MRQFDLIVIGAGSAGCAVAARVAQSGRTVLLLEAGGTNRIFQVKAPAAFASLFGSTRDWNYQCEPQANLNGRALMEPRGKLLGGSSSMNLMLYIRGNRVDYDRWAEAADGWSYDEVLPYFKRAERNTELSDKYHGTNGPLTVQSLRCIDPTSQAWINAVELTGVPGNTDFNGKTQVGVGIPQLTQADGVRCDAAAAYLRPERRNTNLTIETNALVSQLDIRKGRVHGVHYLQGAGRHHAIADQTVLAAGAFGSVEILQRSGVGNPDHLTDLGISVKSALPAVGANLAEHPLVSLHFELRDGYMGLNDLVGRHNLPRASHVARWLTRRDGKLASNLGEAIAHVSSSTSGVPDFQLQFAPIFFAADGRRPSAPSVTMAASYLTPTSTGHVRITSPDPTVRARVQLNLLSHQSEIDSCRWALEKLQEIAYQRPLQQYITPATHNPRDSHEMNQFIARTATHTFHASCSARMGPPTNGVVDNSLRVYGLDNLRVADASVFPNIPRANTNAAAVMVGERCADLIVTPERHLTTKE